MGGLRWKQAFTGKIHALILTSLLVYTPTNAQLQSQYPVCSTAFLQPIITAIPQTIFINEYIPYNTTIFFSNEASITVNNAPTLLVTRLTHTLYQSPTIEVVNNQDVSVSSSAYNSSPLETGIATDLAGVTGVVKTTVVVVQTTIAYETLQATRIIQGSVSTMGSNETISTDIPSIE